MWIFLKLCKNLTRYIDDEAVWYLSDIYWSCILFREISYLRWSISLCIYPKLHVTKTHRRHIIQGGQKVSVNLMITVQSSGAQRLFDHYVYIFKENFLKSPGVISFMRSKINLYMVLRVFMSVCKVTSAYIRLDRLFCNFEFVKVSLQAFRKFKVLA